MTPRDRTLVLMFVGQTLCRLNNLLSPVYIFLFIYGFSGSEDFTLLIKVRFDK